MVGWVIGGTYIALGTYNAHYLDALMTVLFTGAWWPAIAVIWLSIALSG
jgi:hypothetical protein